MNSPGLMSERAGAPGSPACAADLGPARGIAVAPAAPGDVDALQAFVAALSPATRTRRFFAPVPRMPGEMVRAIATADPRHRFLVARSAGGRVIALAQAVAEEGAARCELAIVVADAWQGLGVGTRLFALLLADAAGGGAREAHLETARDNRPMKSLARRFGFEFGRHPEDPELLLGRRALHAAAQGDAAVSQRCSNERSASGSTGLRSMACTPWRCSSSCATASALPV